MEIGRVDGEDERVIEDGFVEPVGDDQFDAVRPPIAVGALLPFVDPGETVAAAFGGLADRCRDGGRLQPVQRRLEALIVAQRCAAPDIGEDFIGRRGHQPGRAKSVVTGFHDLAGGPDQDVGVPDRGHAMIGDGLDADGDVARCEVYRRDAMGFGEGEERIGHEILRISWREVAGERAKQIKLPTLRRVTTPHHHERVRPGSARVSAGALAGRQRLALCGKHGAARIGR